MYVPAAFADTDLATLDALVARDPFVTLVTSGGPDGLQVTHLPVLYARDGDAVELRGHWARANPQSAHAGDALAIVHGPHAYVAAGWYPDKEAAGRVPTWNYVVAHVHGPLERIEDEAALADLVDALSRRHEPAAGSDWRFDPSAPRESAKLRGIVGFRMRATRVEMAAKLGQNHPVANRAAVADRLDASGRPADREVAALMRATIATAPQPLED